MPVSVPASNTFESVLRNQRKGVMAADLSEKLAELTRAVCAYGKPGKLILTLKLNPASGDGTALSIADEVEIKPPAAPKPNSIFFTSYSSAGSASGSPPAKAAAPSTTP